MRTMKQFFLVVLLCLGELVLSKPSGQVKSGIFKVTPSTNNEENALDLEVVFGPDDVIRARGKLGLSLPAAAGQYQDCGTPGEFCVEWGDFARLQLKRGRSENCGRIEWTSSYAREIEDCFELEDGVHWYGGPEMYTQHWPIETNSHEEGAYLSQGPFSGIIDRYWLLSNGAALVVDPEAPLHYSMNSTHRNRVCFVARDQAPYTKRSPLTFGYEWCTGENVKDTHLQSFPLYFDLPSSLPDEGMLLLPYFSTWAEYKTEVNQTNVLEYARRVVSEGFGKSSHIQIDDDWETCYGEQEFNREKFPDPKEMVDQIKAMNMRVTLWTHPFVNFNCPKFTEGMNNGYFVKDAKGKVGITSWWQGANTGILDATNPEAVNWFSSRLRKLQEDFGFDSFKFDAGETGLLPASSTFQAPEELWPHVYSTKYIEVCAEFGGLVETRIAHLNQKLPMFFRMGDKDSRWGYNNGLKSLIPTLLVFSIVGYPFVLPDMIGGNAYGELPSKELFVRWMQANAFMPSVQFSIVPWKYDQEVVDITLEAMRFREQHQDKILEAARESVANGSPVNRPIWWVDPTDATTFTIDDAYMVGDTILVAPVVEEGATSRNIYLPRGTWVSGLNSSESHEGPLWLNDYPAPLNVLPFFIKQ